MTTPDVDPLPPKDPEDTVNSKLPNAVPLKDMANNADPNALRDTAISADPNALKDTANSADPNALRDTASSADPNALRDTANSRLPNALRDTANSALLSKAGMTYSRRWCRDAYKPNLELLKEVDTDSSSALPSRDVPLEDTDSSSVLPSRARASAALAAVVVRAPADMAALVDNKTRVTTELLSFARDSKAMQGKQNRSRAIDQADTAARLKLLPSAFRDTVVLPRFVFHRSQ